MKKFVMAIVFASLATSGVAGGVPGGECENDDCPPAALAGSTVPPGLLIGGLSGTAATAALGALLLLAQGNRLQVIERFW